MPINNSIKYFFATMIVFAFKTKKDAFRFPHNVSFADRMDILRLACQIEKQTQRGVA